MIVIISESNIGFHSKTPQDCELIPFVFIPTISKTKDDTYNVFINVRNERILNLINLYNQGENITFLLGYDLDENGEIMAHAFRNFLLNKNIKDIDIIRTPLTEEGYIATCDFIDIQELLKFKYLQKEFQKELKEKKIESISFFDLISIRRLNTQKGKDINFDNLKERIDIEKTSTITFVVNNLLKETENV